MCAVYLTEKLHFQAKLPWPYTRVYCTEPDGRTTKSHLVVFKVQVLLAMATMVHTDLHVAVTMLTDLLLPVCW